MRRIPCMDEERTPENGVDVNDEGIWRARGKGVVGCKMDGGSSRGCKDVWGVWVLRMKENGRMITYIVTRRELGYFIK